MEFFTGLTLFGVATAAMIWLSPTEGDEDSAYERGYRPYGGMGSPSGPERSARAW